MTNHINMDSDAFEVVYNTMEENEKQPLLTKF